MVEFVLGIIDNSPQKVLQLSKKKNEINNAKIINVFIRLIKLYLIVTCYM